MQNFAGNVDSRIGRSGSTSSVGDPEILRQLLRKMNSDRTISLLMWGMAY
jgi:hypothetical protein